MNNEEYNERYDRQIRLWGIEGQRKFDSANICLISANTLGAEILKGLCLAGVNKVTIFDDCKVTTNDLETNFFLPPTSLSQNRGSSVIQSLEELGNGITIKLGSFENHLPHSTSSNFDDGICSSNYWKQFSVVIVCDYLYHDQMTMLSHICWDCKIPLMIVKSIGFFGYIEIQARDHTIIDESTNISQKKDSNPKDDVKMTTDAIFNIWNGSEKKKLRSSEDEENSEYINQYLGLKAIELFFFTYGRRLTYRSDEIETNLNKLKDCLKKHFIFNGKTLDQTLYEVCRVADLELLSTSAFLGGCAAQEAIKLITNLYHPVNNIMVYNAISASTRVLKYNDIFL